MFAVDDLSAPKFPTPPSGKITTPIPAGRVAAEKSKIESRSTVNYTLGDGCCGGGGGLSPTYKEYLLQRGYPVSIAGTDQMPSSASRVSSISGASCTGSGSLKRDYEFPPEIEDYVAYTKAVTGGRDLSSGAVLGVGGPTGMVYGSSEYGNSVVSAHSTPSPLPTRSKLQPKWLSLSDKQKLESESGWSDQRNQTGADYGGEETGANMSLGLVAAGTPMYANTKTPPPPSVPLSQFMSPPNDAQATKSVDSWMDCNDRLGQRQAQQYLECLATLFVSNLALSVDESAVAKVFEAVGNIWSVSLTRDRNGESRGFAYVIMCSNSEARAALEALQGVKVCGRRIWLELVSTHGEQRTEFEKRTCGQLSRAWCDLPECIVHGSVQDYDEVPKKGAQGRGPNTSIPSGWSSPVSKSLLSNCNLPAPDSEFSPETRPQRRGSRNYSSSQSGREAQYSSEGSERTIRQKQPKGDCDNPPSSPHPFAHMYRLGPDMMWLHEDIMHLSDRLNEQQFQFYQLKEEIHAQSASPAVPAQKTFDRKEFGSTSQRQTVTGDAVSAADGSKSHIEYLRRLVMNDSASLKIRSEALGSLNAFHRNTADTKSPPSATMATPAAGLAQGPTSTTLQNCREDTSAVTRADMQMMQMSKDITKMKAHSKLERMQQDSTRLVRIETQLASSTSNRGNQTVPENEGLARCVDQLRAKVEGLETFSRAAQQDTEIRDQTYAISDRLGQLERLSLKTNAHSVESFQQLQQQMSVLMGQVEALKFDRDPKVYGERAQGNKRSVTGWTDRTGDDMRGRRKGVFSRSVDGSMRSGTNMSEIAGSGCADHNGCAYCREGNYYWCGESYGRSNTGASEARGRILSRCDSELGWD